MITGKFVSCYSCAGEESDPNDQLQRGRWRRGVPKSTILCHPSRVSTRIGSARFIFLIIFQNYTAITFKIQSWGWGGFDSVAGMGEARESGGGSVAGWEGSRLEEGFWEGAPHKLSDKHYKFKFFNINSYFAFLFKKFGKRRERMWCMLKCPRKHLKDLM